MATTQAEGGLHVPVPVPELKRLTYFYGQLLGPQDLQGDDHGGQVQTGVAHAGEHDGIARAPDRDSAWRLHRSRQAHARAPPQ